MSHFIKPQQTTEILSDEKSSRLFHLRKTMDQLTGTILPPEADGPDEEVSDILNLLRPVGWEPDYEQIAQDRWEHSFDEDAAQDRVDNAIYGE